MTKAQARRPNEYKGWQIFRDHDGDWRCYHRKTRAKIDCRKFVPYTLAFDMEIHRINELVEEKQAKPGTLGMLITRYRESVRFRAELAPRTRADYQKCFDYLQAIEDTPLDRFTPPLIAKIRDKALEKRKFRFANYVRSVLSVIFDWGIEYGYTKDNPSLLVEKRGLALENASNQLMEINGLRHLCQTCLPCIMTIYVQQAAAPIERHGPPPHRLETSAPQPFGGSHERRATVPGSEAAVASTVELRQGFER